MLFFRIFTHLLPRAAAWLLTKTTKQITQFFQGLTVAGSDAREFTDLAYLDLFPQSTRELAEWELTFNLRNAINLTEQDRRDRLEATWGAVGGQSPRYIQDTLQANGFDVYVHDWWVEPAGNPPVARNPNAYLDGSPITFYITEMGEPLAEMGEADMGMGETNGLGFLLVNKVTETTTDVIPLMGEPDIEMSASDDSVLMGQFDKYIFTLKQYLLPTDSDLWPYFVYVGAATFPDFATVPADRRNEFETLLKNLMPGQLWIGELVTFT